MLSNSALRQPAACARRRSSVAYTAVDAEAAGALAAAAAAGTAAVAVATTRATARWTFGGRARGALVAVKKRHLSSDVPRHASCSEAEDDDLWPSHAGVPRHATQDAEHFLLDQ